jgi:hypothetical protein
VTYRSAQEHDERVDALRRNPEALTAIVRNPQGATVGELGFAMRALR